MATEFPQKYLNTLDKILAAETFTAAYQVAGAEFVNAKTVNIPEIVLGESLHDYDGTFAGTDKAEVKYETYTLAQDKAYSFTVDAVEDMDEQHLRVANGAAEVQRRLAIPAMDTNFFAKAAAGAGTKKTYTLGVTDGGSEEAPVKGIKTALREVRSKFVAVGCMDADLFISSTALAMLEDATERQWASEDGIYTMIGKYDIFNIYEVPDALLACDFIAIAGGQNTVKQVVKRAKTQVIGENENQNSDGVKVNMRWVFDTIVYKKQAGAIFTNKGAQG